MRSNLGVLVDDEAAATFPVKVVSLSNLRQVDLTGSVLYAFWKSGTLQKPEITNAYRPVIGLQRTSPPSDVFC